jgi:ADP-ribosylglycohydrolase
VPQSIISFLEGDNFESAVRNAINLGGDADTMAAIAGSIAEAYYGIPVEIVNAVQERIPAEFWSVLDEFSQKYLPTIQIHGNNSP